MTAFDGGERRLDERIHEAVRIALVEKTIADHESRLQQLERFRWWILSAVAVGASTSTGTLLILLVKGHP